METSLSIIAILSLIAFGVLTARWRERKMLAWVLSYGLAFAGGAFSGLSPELFQNFILFSLLIVIAGFFTEKDIINVISRIAFVFLAFVGGTEVAYMLNHLGEGISLMDELAIGSLLVIITFGVCKVLYKKRFPVFKSFGFLMAGCCYIMLFSM